MKLGDQLLYFPWVIIFTLLCLPYFALHYVKQQQQNNQKPQKGPKSHKYSITMSPYISNFTHLVSHIWKTRWFLVDPSYLSYK